MKLAQHTHTYVIKAATNNERVKWHTTREQ